MQVKYTKQQQKVIDARNCNILVSAAAGSGKTAVLVERIIGLIREGVDVDTLLVVTFTEAAAAEMRERLRIALSRIAIAEPENRHIQRQTVLIHNAQIATIHGFCLQVLKNHFQEISLEPSFRVADEGEVKLIRHDVMEEMLEEYYTQADSTFLDFAERYAQIGDTTRLAEIVEKLYHDAISHPFWEAQLYKYIENLTYETTDEMEQSDWMKYVNQYENAVYGDALRIVHKAIEMCNDSFGPQAYTIALLDDEAYLSKLLAAKTHTERAGIHRSFKHMDLSRKKSESVSEEQKESVKYLRDMMKKSISDVKKKLYAASIDDEMYYQNCAGESAKTAVLLALDFGKRFLAYKREKNLIDFNDMEHLALQVLVKSDGENVRPTETAVEYQKFFTEILTDEYQDSNEVQELLLWAVSGENSGVYNRFMVGDVKQSIYRFRLARPEIFMHKYDTYEADGKDFRKIVLSTNFRSRSEVIDSANYLFERIMTKNLGNVAYDDDAKLYLGAEYPIVDPENCATELLLFQKSNGGTEEEAYLIASKINDMVGKTLVTDAITKELRPAEYRDIVILLRTAQGVDDTYRRVLELSGIPVHLSSRSGYFAAREIITILNYIDILVNPRQDIPLQGILHSVLGGFSESEIATIRVEGGEKKCLFDSLCLFVGQTRSVEDKLKILEEKVRCFLGEIEYYRSRSVFLPVYELIRTIFEDKKYLYIMSAQPGGEQRCANLRMLLAHAKKFENTSYSGLFDFIRYLQLLKQREIDFGEANVSDEAANVVKIMTIHKSKGLEFPICIVAQLGRKFSTREYADSLLTDTDIGIGLRYLNLEQRYQTDTLRRNAIIFKQKADSRGEDFRVLYVAMTRAKEKLILTGRVGDLEKKVKGAISSLEVRGDSLSYTERLKATSFLDLIIPAIAEQKSFADLCKQNCNMSIDKMVKTEAIGEVRITVYDTLELQDSVSAQSVSKSLLEEHLISECTKEADEEFWEERFTRHYMHDNLRELYTKTTVSELKHVAFEEALEESRSLIMPESEQKTFVPSFVEKDEEKQGAKRGTAYHRLMELLNFKMLTDDKIVYLKNEIDRILTSGRMDYGMKNLISDNKILCFLGQPIAQRMAHADTKHLLFKEQPFVIGVPADTVRQDFPSTETILVQGVIDVYFEEDGELILLDYKTDRVNCAEELVKRYKTQLDYYEKALNQLTGKKVSERLIYSFALGRTINV